MCGAFAAGATDCGPDPIPQPPPGNVTPAGKSSLHNMA